MPSRAWVGVSPLAIWSTIGRTSSIGIAKPRPIEPASAAGGALRRPADRGVDADDLAGHVDQRAAAVAGVDRRVGLDRRVDVALPCASGPTFDRPVQRADDAAGDGGVEAERRADRDDALADVEVAGLPMVAGVRPETSSAWMTAVSVSGSVPRISAGACCRR